jgi:GTP-binding protein LepA
MYMALEHDLEIIPVINKIDLPSADIEGVKKQISHDLGLDPDGALLVSGKLGTGVDDLCEAIVERVPPPRGGPEDPLKALIFDSHYDTYRGVIVHVRVYEGTLRPGQTIRFWWNGSSYKVEETGIFRLGLVNAPSLGPGEVGYLIAGIKTIADTRVGDTVTDHERPCAEPLAGFREVKPVVFSSIYPVDANDYEELVEAMAKLKLNDASLVYEKDSSVALGYGFRCGFLGLLHLEIVQERLEREFEMSIVFTAPSVQYRVTLQGGKVVLIDNPATFPDPSQIQDSEEPYIAATMITPSQYLGNIITLCLEKRGTQKSMNYLDEKRVELVFDPPWDQSRMSEAARLALGLY